ncbi:hypothetical protein L6164_024501 [Bauhinia variegata]|uniref:Uncharacterized protein n=1 Tax=Bauhinia variegata TaxID=167791 RepID=A0ACB9LXZ8_BAUVA|nr:hypothetical protein L6164_024501 [Bauhinia variegata]
MGRVANQHLRRWKRTLIWGVAFLCCMCFLLFTPRISRSHKHHQFVDMRNLLGFVFALQGGLFNISSKAEVWAWVLFYAGTASMAFGSAYYHLKPDNNRLLWDTLPIMVAYIALLSSLLVERIGQRTGLCCTFSLLLASFLCVAYERIYNDNRFCTMFQLILPVAIPGVAFFYSSKYTHSSYWFWSAGIYLLAKLEAVADRKLYQLNNFTISGHSLEHLCSALIPVLLSVMLTYRGLKFSRLGELKDWP